MNYDVIIIGAGVTGLSIAWRSAERGMRVVVLERGKIGRGTSSRGVGGIRQQFDTPINIALSQLSLPVFVALREHIEFQQHGYLYLAQSEASRAGLRHRLALQQAHDVPAEWLEPDEIRDRFSYLRLDDIHGGTFCALDGYVLPPLVVAAYAARAQAAGAKIAEGTAVTGVLRSGGRVCGVRTDAGAVMAERVVNAAGPWAAHVAALAEVEVPVVPLKRQVWMTKPTEVVPATAPLTIDSESGWHFRPRESALLFAMSGNERPGDESLDLDPMLAERMLAGGRHRLPGLDVGVSHGWAGLYEVTPDAHPILGPCSKLPGFYLACGFSGHELMHSPAVGLLMAAALGGDRPALDISPVGLERFAAGQLLGDGAML